MKKWIAFTATLLLATSIQAAYKDGTYTGQGQGKEGPIVVQVDVAGGKICSVKITKAADTPALLQNVEASLAKRVIKRQGTAGVRAVSGATLSSNGVLDAVYQALQKAQ